MNKKGEKTMKYEEPEMKVIYLEEGFVTTLLISGPNQEGGQTDFEGSGMTDTFNLK